MTLRRCIRVAPGASLVLVTAACRGGGSPNPPQRVMAQVIGANMSPTCTAGLVRSGFGAAFSLGNVPAIAIRAEGTLRSADARDVP